MKNSLDQGTVIYGIKSDKYPAFPCYGIIITARCDIAQNKVPKYHYLVAVDASSWFSSKHGYQLVYSKTIADKMKTVCDKATALELDGQTLLSTSTEQLEIILQDKKQQLSGDRKAIKKVDELYACIQQYTQVAQIESDDVHRKKAIKSNTKSAIAYIKDIDSGKLHHYYFLPQTAYLDNGVKSKGLIVDLLEIRSLSLLDAKKIANPFSSGILYKWIAEDGVALLEKSIKRKCNLLDRCSQISVDSYTLTSPYAINGLEFQAVVLLGADEGRVPQTSGTSDISRHFLMYSAYNMLYLSASRAKYRVIIMGSELQGISTCLDHSIQAKVIEVKKHSKIPC